jgi:hypothetical protein
MIRQDNQMITLKTFIDERKNVLGLLSILRRCIKSRNKLAADYILKNNIGLITYQDLDYYFKAFYKKKDLIFSIYHTSLIYNRVDMDTINTIRSIL